MREGERIFAQSVTPPFDKTPVKSKSTSSIIQACHVKALSFLPLAIKTFNSSSTRPDIAELHENNLSAP